MVNMNRYVNGWQVTSEILNDCVCSDSPKQFKKKNNNKNNNKEIKTSTSNRNFCHAIEYIYVTTEEWISVSNLKTNVPPYKDNSE